MPRASATADPFTAVAEPGRRRILELLGQGERPVNDLVQTLGWAQPQVSKRLGALRQAGLVSVRRRGRQRMYRINAENLKPIHDWVSEFERFWDAQLDRIKARAEQHSGAAPHRPAASQDRQPPSRRRNRADSDNR
ncbi:MAG: ArsR/SmtB family transcription factor [Phycisphaerales bacterium JB039]